MGPRTIKTAGPSLCLLAAFLLVSMVGATDVNAANAVIVKQESTTQQRAVLESFPEQESHASTTSVGNGKRETLDVPVISWRDLPFQTVKKQGLDYSCGSAAISTLLTYVYDKKTSEGSIFKAMFDAGDQDKIRQEGFSLLDMSRYLNSRGFKTTGFKASLSVIEKNKVPFIALINDNGYNHFVVVKSIKGRHLLVGDPNKGNVIYPRTKFEAAWNGIALVVTNHAKKASKFFDSEREWRYARRIVDPNGADYAGIDNTALSPLQWQIVPSTVDILSTANQATSNVLQQLGSGNLTGAGGVP